MAYRNIKNNKGSNTRGTDNITIKDIWNEDEKEFIKIIQNKLENYKPQSVRRVMIPKPDGSLRPLGIPCMIDRIIQQCIKQVIEPICEAKFHQHSYGFRPNRSTEHAIARTQALINNAKMNYVVDIDIKGFFENVNHVKLIKQMWNLGIQDKNLICIIRKILKSEIEGEGIPDKGTPQGGIISPLLSNIVLNELDWWISNQWETFKSSRTYHNASNKYKALRNNTKLKEIFIVRYADDFKIFCKDYKTAQKIFIATKLWLKERLDLEISPTKSKVTNLRKNYTEFLGFKLKAIPKKNKFVCKAHMAEKSKEKVYNNLYMQIKNIQNNPINKEVIKLNSIILGIHNYYKYATHICKDMDEIDYKIRRILYTRLKNHITDKDCRGEAYKRFYGKYKGKLKTINNVTIFPIYACKNQIPLRFTQEICNYTEQGRNLVHKQLNEKTLIEYLIRSYHESKNIKLLDNSISLMAGQKGKCFVTGKPLEIGKMEIHHKIRKSDGGTDDYNNLIWINSDIHELIHSTKRSTIEKYLSICKLNLKSIKKINKLRLLAGNDIIENII